MSLVSTVIVVVVVSDGNVVVVTVVVVTMVVVVLVHSPAPQPEALVAEANRTSPVTLKNVTIRRMAMTIAAREKRLWDLNNSAPLIR